MKADTADTTTDPAAREQRRATLACNLAYEFTRSAGATVLAAEGICAISEHSEPGKWATEALIDAAARTHNLAERLAALLRNEPCRWQAGQTAEEEAAVDAAEDAT